MELNLSRLPDRRQESSVAHRRWDFLDALRGVALAGILFVNLPMMVSFAGMGSFQQGTGPVREFYDLWLQGRFVPIFAFLFGVSAFLFFDSVRSRRDVKVARKLVLRRFLFLLPIGIVHLLLIFSGDILTFYALAALLTLVPAMFAPRWLVLVFGIALTAAIYFFIGSSVAIPLGLFPLGWAMAAYGLPRRLELANWLVLAVFVGSGVLGLLGVFWQREFQPLYLSLTDAGSAALLVFSLTGLCLAVAYVSGLSLLWRSPAKTVLAAVFTPLGKMALTNYLLAGVLVSIVFSLIDANRLDDPLWYPVISIGILILQIAGSAIWLRFFRFGPVEWIWRMLTRWQRVPLRLVKRN